MVEPAADEQPLTQDSLVIDGLSKTFPGTVALKDFSVSIHAGEVHALVGQNGSGKSTFIKLLAGFHEPDPGWSAMVRGQPLSLGNADAAHVAGLRFVHQDLGLVESASTVENLALGFGYHTGHLYRIKWRKERDRAREIIGQLGHEFDVDIPVSELSVVERATVALGRAMQVWDSTGVAVLVLDEPTATMTERDVKRMFDLIQRARRLGASVIYVSHHLDEVFAIADRITILRDGRKVATLETADTSVDQLVELMCGEVKDEPKAGAHVALGDPVLEIHELSGATVRRLDLSARSGEIVGIAGIDGSGRDMISRLIFGGLPRGGTVTVAGTSLPPLRPDLAVAAGVGFVPADRRGDGLLMTMTLQENLTLATLGQYWRRLILRSGRERSDVVEWMSRLKVVPPNPDAVAETLSGGNQQKIVIGKWLCLRPRVLLLDEPTQGIDVAAKAEVHQLLDEAAGGGAAVVVCSSDELELTRLCSRVIVLRQGEVAAVIKGSTLNVEAITRASLAEGGPVVQARN